MSNENLEAKAADLRNQINQINQQLQSSSVMLQRCTGALEMVEHLIAEQKKESEKCEDQGDVNFAVMD